MLIFDFVWTKILKHLQATLQNFNSRVQIDVVAIEATAPVVQSLQVALYVDPADTKAVEQSIAVVVEKYFLFNIVFLRFILSVNFCIH